MTHSLCKFILSDFLKVLSCTNYLLYYLTLEICLEKSTKLIFNHSILILALTKGVDCICHSSYIAQFSSNTFLVDLNSQTAQIQSNAILIYHSSQLPQIPSITGTMPTDLSDQEPAKTTRSRASSVVCD